MISQVSKYAQGKLERLCADERTARAMLARLRRGVGTVPGDMPELWGVTFSGMAEEMLSTCGAPTKEEWAVHIALTMFALHQQGHDVKTQCMHRQGQSLGKALRRFCMGDEEARKRIKRRFDAVATADNIGEAAYHLRGLIQLLRSESIPLDYAALAGDLYFFQIESTAPSVRLAWGQDFYRTGKGEENGETDEKTHE